MKKKTYDAILLLGLRLHEDGTAAPELLLRVKKAAECYQKGLAPRIIACGGLTRGIPRKEADVMAEHLIALGVPDDRIIREGESRITSENIINAVKLLGGAEGKRVLVVSSDYHVFRAKLICRQCGLKADGCAARLPIDRYTPNVYLLEGLFLLSMLLHWDKKGYPTWAKKAIRKLHVPR